MLARLALRFRLGVLSNWPLALTIDRFIESAGWSPHFHSIIVSQRVGTIKPHPEIFRVAAVMLEREPAELLHVGDDWAADVVGAKEAGWRAAYLRARVASPLPASERDGRVRADAELDTLAELETILGGGHSAGGG
jgi:putative hydrolase of the HAD superfamily